MANNSIGWICVSLGALGCVETEEAAAVSVAEACFGTDGSDRISDPTANGLVVGTINAPSGDIPVAGAVITVTVGGVETTTLSGASGCFSLELPPGDHAISIEKGRYGADSSATTAAGYVTDLGPLALDSGDLAIAVVYGKYDDVGELIEQLGLSYTAYSTPADLYDDTDLLAQYDAVFANCGSDASTTHDGAYTSAQLSNVAAWVEAGGTLYASDWEVSLFEGVAPDAVDLADPTLDGPPDTTVQADILDRNIQALLGTATTDINFELAGWALMDGVVDATPLVTGEVEGVERPLAVMHSPGKGRMVFTSFHNEEQLSEAMRVILFELILAL
jgi:Carboxypeptidase regulatory-like domain